MDPATRDGQPVPHDTPGEMPGRRPAPSTALRWGPLRSRNFRLLTACNIISVTGSQAGAVAIPFAVLRSGGSASDVGYVATAELIPLIACLLLGGVIADRLPRHHVIGPPRCCRPSRRGSRQCWSSPATRASGS